MSMVAFDLEGIVRGVRVAAGLSDLPATAANLLQNATCALDVGRSSNRSVSGDGVQRFVDDGWHDKAIALGWPEEALYGEGQGAQVIGKDRVLFVTSDMIMACSKSGFARPIYRGVVY
jgi:hypothetical protein